MNSVKGRGKVAWGSTDVKERPVDHRMDDRSIKMGIGHICIL